MVKHNRRFNFDAYKRKYFYRLFSYKKLNYNVITVVKGMFDISDIIWGTRRIFHGKP